MAQHFYDGQIRRYITQTIRIFSNFTVKYSDGTLVRIPVMYGDPDRQVAAITRQNSENVINSAPRIAIYVSGLEFDRSRLGDSTYVGKMHIRERDIDTGTNSYNNTQGRNYTVERLMPTPFKLSLKADIWSANTDQKLQILEQILVLFNPSLELQTTDNYIDWTSLSVLDLVSVNWGSRTVPVGNDTPIDIATLTLSTPIWISPPVKVKHLGVITHIITNFWQNSDSSASGYIDGLGIDHSGSTTTLSGLIATDHVTITDYNIRVFNGQAVLLGRTEPVVPNNTIHVPIRPGAPLNWKEIFDTYPEKYVAGASKLFLMQENGAEIVGTIAVNPLDSTVLVVSWDPDTLNTNTGIDSQGHLETDSSYNPAGSNRPNSPGTFDAIIDPTTVYPGQGMKDVVVGDRFLIIEDISTYKRTYDGEQDNSPGTGTLLPGVYAWGEFNANANDIVEWDGTHWHVIFDSVQEPDTLIYQTNIYTGIQFMWNGISWVKSFEGDYRKGTWRIEL